MFGGTYENGRYWTRIPPENTAKTGGRGESGAKCGASSRDSDTVPTPAKPTDPELAEVAEAWPALPRAIRAGILAMVRDTQP